MSFALSMSSLEKWLYRSIAKHLIEIKNKLTVNRGNGGKVIMGEKGERSSRNMYKGPMDKAKRGKE